MAQVHVPKGFRRIIDRSTRKIRIVSEDMAPLGVVAQQRTGEFAGSTARVLCEPVFMAWELIKGTSKAVSGSNIGVGAQYGWQKMDRNIAVLKTQRAINGALSGDNEAETLRHELVAEGGIDEKTGKGADRNMLAKAAAEAQIPDSWVDEETFVLFASEASVKAQQAPMVPKTETSRLLPA